MWICDCSDDDLGGSLFDWDGLDIDLSDAEMDKLFASCQGSTADNLALLGSTVDTL